MSLYPEIYSGYTKNILVGLMGNTLINRGSLGMEEQPELILETLQRMGDMLGPSAVDLKERFDQAKLVKEFRSPNEDFSLS